MEHASLPIARLEPPITYVISHARLNKVSWLISQNVSIESDDRKTFISPSRPGEKSQGASMLPLRMLRLKEFEKVVDCFRPHITSFAGAAEGFCEQCRVVPFRVVVIENHEGSQRNLALCGRHFSEFRTQNPEWKNELE